jgi:hypothetical protein
VLAAADEQVSAGKKWFGRELYALKIFCITSSSLTRACLGEKLQTIRQVKTNLQTPLL